MDVGKREDRLLEALEVLYAQRRELRTRIELLVLGDKLSITNGEYLLEALKGEK